MSKHECYTVRKLTPNQFRVEKCDLDYNPTGFYDVSRVRGRFFCDCLAGNKETCRHREMVKMCLKGTLPWRTLYHYDTNQYEGVHENRHEQKVLDKS